MATDQLPLLPCPFCGNSKNIGITNERHDLSGGYFIACPKCDASTGLRFACGDDPRPLLVEQWNRRAAIAADRARAVPKMGLLESYREFKASQQAPEQPADSVKMPTTADEAVAMTLIGEAWLRQHAPDRLRKPADTCPATPQPNPKEQS